VIEHVLEHRAGLERVDLLREVADRHLAVAADLAAVEVLGPH